MNKKYMIYSVLIMFLVACKPSFSMGGKLLFKAARTIGVFAVPSLTLYGVNEGNKKTQKLSEAPFVPEVIAMWGKEKAKQLNVTNAEFRYGDDWRSTENTVLISPFDVNKLNEALVTRQEVIKRRDDLKKNRDAHKNFIAQNLFPGCKEIKALELSVIQKSDEVIELCDKKIAQDAMIVKHELGHIKHKDVQNQYYMKISSVLGVEAISFSATYSFNKMFNRKLPNTLKQAVLRSSFAIGAIVPKIVMVAGEVCFYSRYQETEADRFACENAESRLELKEFANYFRKRKHGDEVDFPWLMTHPLNDDRAAMIESYLTKWDAEHADKSSAKAIERS